MNIKETDDKYFKFENWDLFGTQPHLLFKNEKKFKTK